MCFIEPIKRKSTIFQNNAKKKNKSSSPDKEYLGGCGFSDT